MLNEPFVLKLRKEPDYLNAYKLLYLACDSFALKIMKVLEYEDIVPFGNITFYRMNKQAIDKQIMDATKRVKRVLPKVKELWKKFLLTNGTMEVKRPEINWGLENIPIYLEIKDIDIIVSILNIEWITGISKNIQSGPYELQGMKEILGLRGE